MSLNSAARPQQPQLQLLLQQGSGSKLPPINEILKTSVGLLRPVNLVPSVSAVTVASTSNNNVASGAPQQMFRYPYGMPVQPPLILNQRPVIYPQQSQSQPTFRPQQNGHESQQNSRVTVVQESNSVVFVQDGSPFHCSAKPEVVSPVLSPFSQQQQQQYEPIVEQKIETKKPRQRKVLKNGDAVKNGKRLGTPELNPSTPEGAFPKQKRRKKEPESKEKELRNELQSVSERLCSEAKAHELELAKNEVIVVSLKEEIARLRKRTEAAEFLVSTLEKKNTSLTNELMLNGRGELLHSLQNLVRVLAQNDSPQFEEVALTAKKVIAQLSPVKAVDDFQRQSLLSNGSSSRTLLGGVDESIGEDRFNISLPSPDLDETDVTNGGFKIQCPHCNEYSTAVLRNLLAHFGRKHHCKWDNSPFSRKARSALAKCPSCQETAKDFLQLSVHFVRTHFRPCNQFSCQFLGCSFASTQQWDLILHVATCHLKTDQQTALPVFVEKPPPLPPPPQIDALSVVSTSSTNSAAPSGNLLCICKHCPYRTERYTDMRKHALRRHGDETAFERREATEADPEISYACGICPSRFFRPGDLKRHRSRYNHFEQQIKQEPDDSCSLPPEHGNGIRFLAPKLNLAARVHAKLARRFLLMNRRKRRSGEENLKKHHQLTSDEVEDMFNKAPPSPDLAMLISNSDIKTLCDFPGDVEKLLGD